MVNGGLSSEVCELLLLFGLLLYRSSNGELSKLIN